LIIAAATTAHSRGFRVNARRRNAIAVVGSIAQRPKDQRVEIS
jgi:hypothetical protein